MRLESAAGPLGAPGFASALYVAVMWLWHIPALYDAALESPVVHVLEHLVFASAGVLYWWHLLSPIRSRRRLGGMGPVAYMARRRCSSACSASLLTFAPDPLYDFYEDAAAATGACRRARTRRSRARSWRSSSRSSWAIALAFLFIRALGESDREDERAERYDS